MELKGTKMNQNWQDMAGQIPEGAGASCQRGGFNWDESALRGQKTQCPRSIFRNVVSPIVGVSKERFLAEPRAEPAHFRDRWAN